MTGWTRRAVLGAGSLSALAGCSTEEPAAGPARATPTTGAGTPSGTPTGPRPADWAALRREVAGSLARPGGRSYDEMRLLQDPRFDDQRPLAVLSAASAGDVAAGIRFAREHDLPVAVRSGGHSYPGWSGGGSPRALVLDCRPMGAVDVRGTTATIGAGAPLVRVYDEVGRQGRAVAAGSCATVGMGGLTLGGGVGVLTRALGLTCDAVTAMEVVTADGTVRTASAEEEPDLFWALRGGGGGHLGVVTSFTLDTAPAPVLQTFYLAWPFAAAATVVGAWQQWAPYADARLWSTLKLLGGTTHPDGPTVLVSGTWTGPADALDARLAGLLDAVPAPTTRSTRTRGYRDAMLSYAGCAGVPVERCTTAPGGALQREAFAATSHVAYAELDAAGTDILLAQVEAAQASGLREAGVSLDALGGRAGDVAPDATAFVHREALATVQYTATYPPGTLADAQALVRGARTAMLPHWGDGAYVNYADEAVADHRRAYWGANADRLARVSAAVDPDGFFTQPQGPGRDA